MARFNSIQIGTVYLTEDGTSATDGCKSEVSGLDLLKSAYTGAVLTPISGNPFSFNLDNDGAGVPLVIKPTVVTPTVLGDLRTLFDSAIASDTPIEVLVSGDTGSFDLNCKPKVGDDLRFSGKFINGRIYDLAINLIVDSIN